MNFKYGKLDFEINIWDKKEYYEVMALYPVQNAEGAVEVGWSIRPAYIETLYVFPIINGQIDWQSTEDTENIFIPDSIKNKAVQLHKDFLINKVLVAP